MNQNAANICALSSKLQKNYMSILLAIKYKKRMHTNINITQETDALIFDNIQDLCIIKQPNTENNYTIKNKRQNKGLRY